MFVNGFQDGMDIDQVLLVRTAERRPRRDGSGEYLRLQLGDRTGALACMVWDDIAAVESLAPAGSPVHVRGRYTDHPRYGPQINLRSLSEAVPGSYAMDDLLDGPAHPPEQMELELRDLLATVRQPHLRLLLERLLGHGSDLWERYRTAPAAKHYHQAYRHGLLEHSLSVAQAVSAISATFGGIDRDVAVTGALLHDIGKLDAYSGGGLHGHSQNGGSDNGGSESGGSGRGRGGGQSGDGQSGDGGRGGGGGQSGGGEPLAIDLTDSGRLHGEIPLGYYRVRRAIEDIPGFPRELEWAVLHIILSHHGTLEHGSPVVPCTREATLVHMIDNLGGRLGSFDRIEKELAPGSRQSGFDRGIGASAFFGLGAEPGGDVRGAASGEDGDVRGAGGASGEDGDEGLAGVRAAVRQAA